MLSRAFEVFNKYKISTYFRQALSVPDEGQVLFTESHTELRPQPKTDEKQSHEAVVVQTSEIKGAENNIPEPEIEDEDDIRDPDVSDEDWAELVASKHEAKIRDEIKRKTLEREKKYQFL